MKKNQIIKFIISASIFPILIWSCNPETPNDPNEQEVITSLKITAMEGSNTYTFAYSDPDGSGGNIPSIDTIFLNASTSYAISLDLLDETKTPVDTVTTEIVAEAVDHQFFFMVSGANLTNTYSDLDVNGHPIGLQDVWTTGFVSSGTIMITLRHQPNKSAPNVSSGNISAAGGETDVEVTFPIIIQ